MIALLLGLAFGATLEKTGIPAQDKLFAEVGNLDFVLTAAEQRMQKLETDVAKAMGLGAKSPLAHSVWSIKQAANGDIRMMVADERPILALGDDAPKKAREAAGVLNEGTQEVAVMARDVARLPARMNELIAKSKKAGVDDASLEANGIDKSEKDRLSGVVKGNRTSTSETAERAQMLAERATDLIEAVRTGMSSTTAPDGAAKPVPAPAPTSTTTKPVKPSGVATIGETVEKAWTQFNDAEMDAAVALLSKADLLLPRQTEPVTQKELLDLFMVRGLVNLVKGDATAAAWSATQALVIDPGAAPDSKLGPQYAKLHKALAKAGLVQTAEVVVKGEGRAYLSGVEVTGGATVELGQGQHLLQIEKDGTWKSSVVYVTDGCGVDL